MAIEAAYGPILMTLEVDFTEVTDVRLREQFPNAIGMAPLVNRFAPRDRSR